jgi:hypothetical protein
VSVWTILDRTISVLMVIFYCALLLMIWHVFAADTSGVPGIRLRIVEPPRRGPRPVPVPARERRADGRVPSLRYHLESHSPRRHGARHRDRTDALVATSPLPRLAGIAELAARKEARP